MRKITKKTIKRIKAGYHDDLMDAIELLIDTYKEDKFDSGYKSCLEDMSVRCYRLAEYLSEQADSKGKLGKDCNGEPLSYFDDTDELAKVIDDYFYNALKDE
jgi:hypothetical protein